MSRTSGAHSFIVAEAAMQMVQEGKKPFYTQFFLNPTLSTNDFWLTLKVLLGLICLRLIVAGAHHPAWRKKQSLIRYFLRPYVKAKKESKFSENIWYSCWHTFSFGFGIYVLYLEGLTKENPGWSRVLIEDLDFRSYWFPTFTEHLNYQNPGWPLFSISTLMRLYYLTELAFWMSCIVFLWFETIRDDFNALFLHHIVTCVLIFVSYISSFWRIGSIILITHDFADILLYSAKALYYSKCSPSIVDGLFICFVLSFFFSRLVIFPLFCLRPVIDPSRWIEWTNGKLSNLWDIPGGIIIPGFLCILQLLHIFWFVLIIKMVIRTMRDKVVSQTGDIRSDDEGDTLDDNSEATQGNKLKTNGLIPENRSEKVFLPHEKSVPAKSNKKDLKDLIPKNSNLEDTVTHTHDPTEELIDGGAQQARLDNLNINKSGLLERKNVKENRF